MIARDWDVTSLTAHLYGDRILHTDETTKAGLGFYFRFQRLDVHSGFFVYAAKGTVTATDTFTPPGCSASGSGSAGHVTWPSTSSLRINFGLDHFLAVVKASNEKPFSITVKCPNVNTTTTAKFLDLKSSPRPQPMHPSETHDAGSSTETATGGFATANIDYRWVLHADVH